MESSDQTPPEVPETLEVADATVEQAPPAVDLRALRENMGMTAIDAPVVVAPEESKGGKGQAPDLNNLIPRSDSAQDDRPE